jgi:hypothetical protein
VTYLSVSDAARRIAGGVRPRDISDAFYQRLLDDRRCPIVSGRRLIPEDYLPFIEQVMRETGRLGAIHTMPDVAPA